MPGGTLSGTIPLPDRHELAASYRHGTGCMEQGGSEGSGLSLCRVGIHTNTWRENGWYELIIKTAVVISRSLQHLGVSGSIRVIDRMTQSKSTDSSIYAQVTVLLGIVWNYICFLMGMHIDNEKAIPQQQQADTPVGDEVVQNVEPQPVHAEIKGIKATSAALKVRQRMAEPRGLFIQKARYQNNYSSTKRIKP